MKNSKLWNNCSNSAVIFYLLLTFWFMTGILGLNQYAAFICYINDVAINSEDLFPNFSVWWQIIWFWRFCLQQYYALSTSLYLMDLLCVKELEISCSTKITKISHVKGKSVSEHVPMEHLLVTLCSSSGFSQDHMAVLFNCSSVLEKSIFGFRNWGLVLCMLQRTTSDLTFYIVLLSFWEGDGI